HALTLSVARYSILLCLLNDPATADNYTLSLHDALPILPGRPVTGPAGQVRPATPGAPATHRPAAGARPAGSASPPPLRQVPGQRSEEHTPELQSRGHPVCRLPLEKTKLII